MVKMTIKKGDEIAVTVTKEWSNTVGAIPLLHYFPGEQTTAARVFLAKLVSATEPNGLWVGYAPTLRPDGCDPGDMMFVPWSCVLAIRTGPGLQSEHEAVGFVKST
jgi:hypothetical protein